MKLLGKIYKEFVKIIICEVMSRVTEKQLEKVENGEKEYGQKKRN